MSYIKDIPKKLVRDFYNKNDFKTIFKLLN